MTEIRDLPLRSVLLQHDAYGEELNEARVMEFVRLMADGKPAPPILVQPYRGGRFGLVDGHNQMMAHQFLGRKEILAVVPADGVLAAVHLAQSVKSPDRGWLGGGHMRRWYEVAKAIGLVQPGDAEVVQKLLQCSTQWAFRITEADRRNAKKARDDEICRKASEGVTARQIAAEAEIAVRTVQRVLARAPRQESTRGGADPRLEMARTLTQPLPAPELNSFQQWEEFTNGAIAPGFDDDPP